MDIPILEAPVERGEFLLGELKRCLAFVADDGVQDDRDAELARLRESHSDASSHDALATSLEGFAYHANKFRERLAQVPEFDLAYVGEALAVANRLRQQSALKLSSREATNRREALALRNRLITLLRDRVNRTRRAARFIFRHHPDIAKLAGSEYERRRRARYRTRAARPNQATKTTSAAAADDAVSGE
jgi:hypothetical protein